MKNALMVILLLSVSACTADEAPVEEPVELTPEPPLTDSPAPSSDEESESMDADEGDATGSEVDDFSDGATESAPADAEMAAPAPSTPPGAATGGIISSGTNAKPQEKCKALESAAERKKCLLKLKRKGR